MKSKPINRVILIVLDSVGIGEAADASLYDDVGSNTLGHIAKNATKFSIPNLTSLGLGNIDGALYLEKTSQAIGTYGKAIETSAGKDTTTGHWELAGLVLEKPFPTFPLGFPQEIISLFETKIGCKTFGNISASGTQIIDELGVEHMRTGFPIVYTSADSVFQIAAHEEIIPLNRLYEICKIARELLKDEFAVGRVIARPFLGSPGQFKRTPNRKDFSLKPGRTVLDNIKESNQQVIAIGKISDIFDGNGITSSIHTDDNKDGMGKTLQQIQQSSSGFIFVNLVDFDSQYGHRRDVEGYAKCLMNFDAALPTLLHSLKDDDVLIITADHGNDPTFKGSDHTRENIPVLVYGNVIHKNTNLGTLNSFADIGATIAEMLGVQSTSSGKSFCDKILNYNYAASSCT